jgi:hypothetical protein
MQKCECSGCAVTSPKYLRELTGRRGVCRECGREYALVLRSVGRGCGLYEGQLPKHSAKRDGAKKWASA